MALIGLKAGLLGLLLPATAANSPWWNNEEAPPHTFALWLGIGLCVGLMSAVAVGLRYQRRRRRRAASVLPDDPFAVEAMRACVSLFSGFEPAWKNRDASAVGRLVSPTVLAGWGARLDSAPEDELSVDGPVSFEYMGAANPGPGANRRAVVRVEGRLRPPSKQVSISGTQRNWLLGLAGVILVAAFVGIALAPASRIRSSPPTTIVVRDGVPLGGTHLLTYRQGALINLTVRSDVSDELHFHGYDIHRHVAPGRAVHFLLRATIQGSYPVELEHRQETVAQVTVEP